MLILKILGCWAIISIPFCLFIGRVCALGQQDGRYDALLDEVIRHDKECHRDTIFGQPSALSVHTRRP